MLCHNTTLRDAHSLELVSQATEILFFRLDTGGISYKDG